MIDQTLGAVVDTRRITDATTLAILLIAARRSDQITAELAHHDYDVNQAAAAEISDLHADVKAILERIELLGSAAPSS